MVCDHSHEQLMFHNNNNQQNIVNMATSTITSSSSSNLAKSDQLKCPRCDSSNTKFCYYNNYSLSQPRHVCKACKRYWTRGGTLRKVPLGGVCRKNKRAKKQNVNSTKLLNPNPIRSSLANPNIYLNQLPASSSADLSSLLLYGDVNLSSFSTMVNPQKSALDLGGLINNSDLTFLNNNDYSSFGCQLKQPKIEEYNQPMFPYDDLQQMNMDLGYQNNLVGNINNSEIWQANYPFETLNVANDSSYLNWNSAIASVSGWHDATNSSITPLI